MIAPRWRLVHRHLAYGIPLAVPRIPFLSVLELEAESSIGLILEDD